MKNYYLDKNSLRDIMWQLCHEWNEQSSKTILEKAGISNRNWTMYMQRLGLADGEKWTFAMLADKYNITRPRAFEIIYKTEKNFNKFCQKINKGEISII